jgi:hypothetical protein
VNKSLAEFTKRTSEGWHKFQLVFLSCANGWEIIPAMLIRKNVVEDLYHRASFFDAKYHKTTPNIGITVEKLRNDEQSYRFVLKSRPVPQ